VTDGESEGDDCDEVMRPGWGEPGGQWIQWGLLSILQYTPTPGFIRTRYAETI